MNKAYSMITWEDLPSEETPINASNLNKMSDAINKIDDRVVTLDEDAHRYAAAIQDVEPAKNSWFKIADVEMTITGTEYTIVFLVTRVFGNCNVNGILRATARLSVTGKFEENYSCLTWETADSGINTEEFIMACKVVDSVLHVELWSKCSQPYTSTFFDVIGESGQNSSRPNYWKLYKTYSSNAKSEPTKGYTQIKSTISTLQNNTCGDAGSVGGLSADDIAEKIELELLEGKVDMLDSAVLLNTVNMQSLVGAIKETEPDWLEGYYIDNTTGELKDGGYNYTRATDFIFLEKGAIVSCENHNDGGIEIYSYNTANQSYIGLYRTLGNGDNFTAEKDLMVRIEDGNISVVKITRHSGGRVDSIEHRVGAVSEEFDSHKNNTNIHVTAAEKENWNKKSQEEYVYAPLNNGAGWYRFAEYNSDVTNAHNGGTACGCEFTLRRTFSNTSNETHVLRLLSVFQKSDFVGIAKLVNTQVITRIRHVKDLTNLKSYIEFYYNTSAVNNIYISLRDGRDGAGQWGLITPVLSTTDEETMTIVQNEGL